MWKANKTEPGADQYMAAAARGSKICGGGGALCAPTYFPRRRGVLKIDGGGGAPSIRASNLCYENVQTEISKPLQYFNEQRILFLFFN